MSVRFARTVVYPDPRAGDRVRLPPLGRQLVLRLLTPPQSTDRRVTDACTRAARVTRRTLLTAVLIGVRQYNSGERLFALDLLRAGGWAPKADLDDLVWRFYDARSYITHRDQPEPADAGARARHRNVLAGLADQIRVDAHVLAAILDLDRFGQTRSARRRRHRPAMAGLGDRPKRRKPANRRRSGAGAQTTLDVADRRRPESATLPRACPLSWAAWSLTTASSI
jgi:hypothetical protein